VRVSVEGMRSGRSVRLSYQCVEYSDSASGNSAMGRMTSYPASIIAQMMGSGAVTRRGVHPQELAVPAGPFLEELARRDIRVEQREETLG
jgi:lysine 6-dehydrogenase